MHPSVPQPSEMLAELTQAPALIAITDATGRVQQAFGAWPGLHQLTGEPLTAHLRGVGMPPAEAPLLARLQGRRTLELPPHAAVPLEVHARTTASGQIVVVAVPPPHSSPEETPPDGEPTVPFEALVGAFGHELREPTRTLQSFLPLLLESLSLTGDRALFARYLQQATHRLTAQLDGLTRFTRAGRHRPAEAVDLRPLLDDLAHDLDLAPGTLEVGPLQPVLGNPEVLREVFAELLTNSRRFASPDRPLRVQVRVRAFAGRALVSVRDNGSGFPADEVSALFHPFHRHGTRAGVGMGLTVVKRLVDGLDGTIQASGAPDQGAVFELDLPVAPLPQRRQRR